jgi:hypothetical protein
MQNGKEFRHQKKKRRGVEMQATGKPEFDFACMDDLEASQGLNHV